MCGLYLDLEWMHHDLHQHFLVRQEAVQIQTLAFYSLGGFSTKQLILNTHTYIHNRIDCTLKDESQWHTLLRNMA